MNIKVTTTPHATMFPLLDTLNRDNLRKIAANLKVPQGRNRADTLNNLKAAMYGGRLHVKAMWTVSFKPKDNSVLRKTYLSATNRNYVSGPGKGNEVHWVLDRPSK